MAGSTTAPARPQMAESDCGQAEGSSSRRVPEQSELNTAAMCPLRSVITTTWPW